MKLCWYANESSLCGYFSIPQYMVVNCLQTQLYIKPPSQAIPFYRVNVITVAMQHLPGIVSVCRNILNFKLVYIMC